jgi:YVTN family beta-propeller protein
MTDPRVRRQRVVASMVLAMLLVIAIVVVLKPRSRPAATAKAPAAPTATTRNAGDIAASLRDSAGRVWSPVAGAPLSTNIYSADRTLAPAVTNARSAVYVPNSDQSTLDVINPVTRTVVDHIKVGRNPQHVVPAWDLQRLYVANDLANSLTPLDPRTGKRAGADIPVDDPYNMYFTPDGASAIVVAEAHHKLDFRDPHTFALRTSVPVQCAGVDHLDFSADGSYLIASCEFSGDLVKVDVRTHTVLSYLHVGGKPQDVKVDPGGVIFYVADMILGGLHEIDGATFTKVGFLPTGLETHGLYPSRDATVMYVTNRGGIDRNGSVSVVNFTTRQVVETWSLPDTTPDMGGVSVDGKQLWLSGRYTRKVYVIDTTNGRLLASIRVGRGPHGLCVWPQPGRYSLGHTGIMR